MIRAVVFDFDGLILDTETREFQSFQTIFREHGAELDLDVWGGCIGTGPSAFNPYDHLEQCIGRPIERETVRARRRAIYEEAIRETDIRPGVREYIQEAKTLGLAVGLASSSKEAWVIGYLDRFGLTGQFDCIRTGDYVKEVKPNPELYLQTVSRLGIGPEEAVAFEDSPNGALAAKRAGLYTVIVPNAVTKQLSFGRHDLSIDSMNDMPLSKLLRRLADTSTKRNGA